MLKGPENTFLKDTIARITNPPHSYVTKRKINDDEHHVIKITFGAHHTAMS